MAQRGKAVSYEARIQIVQAVLEHGLRIGDVALAHDVHRKTVSQFLRDFRSGGAEALREESRRPHASPSKASESLVAKVLDIRSRRGWGAGLIGAEVKLSGSTVHKILVEHGVNNQSPVKPKAVRYEKDFPGELLHVDSKELVPLKTGRAKQFLYAALDAYSREAFVRVLDKSNAAASQEFLEYLLATVPYPIHAVMTDNALSFSMRRSAHPEREPAFQRILRELEIRHCLTRPYTPRTNGKVERFFGTVGRELLRCIQFKDEAHRKTELLDFAEFYNLSRPHSAIGFSAPTNYRLHFFNEKGS